MACRWSCCTAAPAAGVRRACGSCSTLSAFASSSSTSAAAGAARRAGNARTTRPPISSPTSSGCDAISASSAGSSPAVPGVRTRVAYAAAHREACIGAVLRGVFLTGPADLDWFFGGAAALFPQAWQAFERSIPGDRDRVLADRLFDVVLGDDDRGAAEAVRRWMQWEATLDGGSAVTLPQFPDADAQAALLAKYRVQAHYLRRQCFLGEPRVLELAATLDTLPVVILHGADDLVCRVDNARRLHRAVPHAGLQIVANAGHSPFAASMQQVFVDALGELASERRGNRI